MNIYAHYAAEINRIIAEMDLPFGPDAQNNISATCEAPRDASHGDLATNAAMILARPLGMKPRDLAEKLAVELRKCKGVESVEIAGPGFINLRLYPQVWFDVLNVVLKAGMAWGDSQIGNEQCVNVEYVSANPTGPLHAAHARGAIIGDSMAALLEKTGHQVIREYYVNDAGAQVDVLARSAHLRYREALGEDIEEIPEGYYPGDYLKETGQKFAKEYGVQYQHSPEDEWLPVIRDFAIQDMMSKIKTDLSRLGIKMDVFASERDIVNEGKVDLAMQTLKDKNLLYEGVLEPPKGKLPDDWEPRPQTLFKATDFGDDTDRPVKKSDGTWTYFASDMAYHLNKLNQGAEVLIDIWGADHAGYIKRMQAAVAALSGVEDAFDVRVCQLVNLLDQGKPVKMSKRAGTFITLSDVLDNVGKDILRFIMLTRRPEQLMDFDYAKVKEQSRDNPVFYVQYAHARARSVLRSASISFDATTDLSPLGDEAELTLTKILASYPHLIETAAKSHEPHKIAFYLKELAGDFHSLWNKGREHPDLRFIVDGNDKTTAARLCLVAATASVIKNGLAILGVDAIEEM